ncbi:uncharacterized protein LOC114319718 [Camellia sinensis]|uniref:uncharacterized protein LOC114319718 n=1 Tax=Camellia sinensis TaxID=4442 RepID=UPI0010366E4C|nr:uncharacterized protein LOC114319718 [Camellia sinensis]
MSLCTAIEEEDNNSSETGIPLGDASTRGSKIDSELVMDYSNEFVTHEIFKSPDELIRWARQVGRKNGFVIVVQKSNGGGIRGRKPRLSLACERSGSYRDTRKNSRSKTKKARLTEYLEGHSYAGRLSREETSLLVDMSKSMVRPSEILVTLKQRDDANASTMKTIYKARQRYKVAEKAGRSQMQQLLGQLAMNKYIEWHRSCADTETVTDLFFAHPTSLNLLRAFPKVLLMDCTYKTNRYRLPLLEIVGVTSTDVTFSIAFAYLQYEKEDYYTWALGLLRSVMDENTLPSVIVTDRELTLMNAICTVFPATTNLLCRWHIGKNVLANCKKMFKTKDKWEMFIMSWNMLVMSSSEEVYMQRLSLLYSEFSTYQDALHYVTSSWVESSHAKLKRYLGSSQGNFESNWTRIHNLLELQHSEIKSSFEKSKLIVQHDFKLAQFKELRGNVSITALEIILAESKRASSVGIDITACGCVVRHTHGFPCAHEIANYMRENRPIPLSSVCSYWTKLDMLSTPHTVSEEWTCTPELELFAKQFEEVDPDMKRFLLQKLRELAKPDCTFLIEPEVKSNPRGRPKLKIETSTRHEPSAFEIVASAQDSHPPGVIAKASVTTKKVKTKKKEKAFPSELRRYIKYVKDVVADGNCGFRAIAGLMGFGEE